jgi:tRNA threonylcarbamoyladenosine modification (KEOPS) complex  Pcc1 subunit
VKNTISLELCLNYSDEKTAEAVYSAIGPDNGEYVKAEILGNKIILIMEATSAGSLKNTADDLLACIKVAEESSGLVVSGSAADLDGDSLLE